MYIVKEENGLVIYNFTNEDIKNKTLELKQYIEVDKIDFDIDVMDLVEGELVKNDEKIRIKSNNDIYSQIDKLAKKILINDTNYKYSDNHAELDLKYKTEMQRLRSLICQ